MSSRIRTVLAIVLAALVAVPAGAAAADHAPRTRTRTCRARARRRPALAHDARGEGRPDDADRALPGVRQRRPRSRPGSSGSVLSGGGSTPTENTPKAWADMVDRFQRAALATRLHIPLLYGIDAVHGDGNMHGATVFPHNIGLGATRDPALVRKSSTITAEETRAIGPQWTFAPCICAARDDRWGRTYESFGEDPELVDPHGDRDRRLPGRGRRARRTATACSPPPSTTRATATPQYGTATRRLQDRPGRRDHQPQRLLGPGAAAVRAGRAGPPCRAASCRRSRASTGPRTASATRSRCTATRS